MTSAGSARRAGEVPTIMVGTKCPAWWTTDHSAAAMMAAASEGVEIRDVVCKALLGGVILMGMQLGIPIPAQAADKYAIILQAGKESHEGMARAVHAFLYAKELKEHGHEVVLIFDGAGTEWAEELSNPESQSKLKPMYDELKQTGIAQLICDFCAGAFVVKEQLAQRQLPLVAEYAGHPSIAKWADQGYQLLIL